RSTGMGWRARCRGRVATAANWCPLRGGSPTLTLCTERDVSGLCHLLLRPSECLLRPCCAHAYISADQQEPGYCACCACCAPPNRGEAPSGGARHPERGSIGGAQQGRNSEPDGRKSDDHEGFCAPVSIDDHFQDLLLLR